MAEPGMTLKVEGLAELQKALHKFPKQWPSVARKSLGPGMGLLERHSKIEAPVDEGTLQASIGSEIVKGPGSEIIGKVGSSLDYAIHQEYGPKPGSGYHWKFKPYLRPTLKKYKNKVVKMFEQGIAKALKRMGL